MMKRLLSLLLAGILIFSLVPAQVLATDGAEDTVSSEEATEPTMMMVTEPVNLSEGEPDPAEETKSVWTVTFDADGGTPAPSEQTVTDGETADEPDEPEKDGYIFGGWYHGDAPWDFANAVTEDIDLTAKWKVKVTFDTDGGTPVKEQILPIGSTVTEPTTTNGERYFAGWFDSNNILWNFKEDKVEVNTTLTAKWLIKVTFMDGNTQLKEIGVDNGSKLTQADLPVNPNLEFAGLYKDAELKTAWDFDNDKVTETTTLYTKWQVKVTFKKDTNGAIVGEKILDIGSTIGEFDDPTKKDLVFDKCWYEGFVSPSKVWDLKTKPVYTNTTLVAGWFAEVTFDANGGSFGSTKTEKIYVRPGSTANVPDNLSREGFNLGGWYDKDGNEWISDTTKVNQNITLYAKWNVKVSFVSNCSVAVDDQFVAEGGKIGTAPAPTNPGHALEGWYKDEALTEAWNFATDTFTESITLYAKWEEAVNVIFDKKNGTAHDIIPVGIGKTVTKPEDPKKNDHEFAGWYKDENCTDPWDFKTEVTQSITLYAKWLELFDVTFNSNGGSKVSADEVTKGSTVIEPTAPTRNNYVFGGWYADKELTDPWDFKTDTVEGNTALYAKWNLKVIFDTDGGSSVPVQGVEKGGKVTEPEKNPTKKDFVFGGWYADEDLTDEWDFEKDTINGTTTIYAKWMAEVTFDSKDGSAVDPDTVILDIGDLVEEPDDPVKSNNVFKGWYNGSSKWDFEKNTVSKNTTLTAKWEANPLKISPTTKELYPGETVAFTAKYNNEDVTSKVTWDVDGTDSDTAFDGATLTIGEEEEAGTLRVTVTYSGASDFAEITVKPTYDFKSGSGGKWAQKSTKSLTFECNGPMKEIDKIKIDSKEVKEENYTLTESTDGFKLVLKSAAMSSLTVGKHTLTITFDDGGKAETTFEVIKESDIPETGDALVLPLWMTLFGITAAAALVLLKKRSV